MPKIRELTGMCVYLRKDAQHWIKLGEVFHMRVTLMADGKVWQSVSHTIEKLDPEEEVEVAEKEKAA